MGITVGGTTITFNDGTTQSTAGGAPTTAQVLTATAAASVGAVGTYAHLFLVSGNVTSAGSTVAGSSLRYGTTGYFIYNCGNWQNANLGGSVPYSGTPSGTWRCMGYTAVSSSTVNNTSSTVFLRIS